MSDSSERLDLRRWRTLGSYLTGIGVETLYTLALAGVGALITLLLWLSSR